MKVNHDSAIDVADFAVTILATHPHMVIATADPDGQPWAVPVRTTATETGELTWRSATSARHSQNIKANPKVSATLYSATIEHGEASLFLEGTAAPRPDPVEEGYSIYAMTLTAAWINDDTHTKTPVDMKLFFAKQAHQHTNNVTLGEI